MKELPPEIIAEVEAMIKRRMDNTGETREQAKQHIAGVLDRIKSGEQFDIFDPDDQSTDEDQT
jgi:hypothetical protein